MISTASSDLNLVPFISVSDMADLVNEIGIENFLTGVASYIEQDFKRWEHFDKSPRVACHSPEGVIELMPVADESLFSFKYVNGHPKNTKAGLQTVTAFGVLSDVDSGYPLLLSEMTILTALRTAATSALVAKYLAPSQAKSMALIGNGAQAEFQALAFNAVLGIEKFQLYDVDERATETTINNLLGKGLELIQCASAKEAVKGVDIITTCTADKRNATILSADMIRPGMHINAIGGDCPGKTELDKESLLMSDIFVEYTPQTRIEGEIQQLAADHSVTEFWQLVAQQAPCRKDDQQITIFDGVGFALEDFSALRFVHDYIQNSDKFKKLDLVASPRDPKNLFALVQPNAVSTLPKRASA